MTHHSLSEDPYRCVIIIDKLSMAQCGCLLDMCVCDIQSYREISCADRSSVEKREGGRREGGREGGRERGRERGREGGRLKSTMKRQTTNTRGKRWREKRRRGEGERKQYNVPPTAQRVWLNQAQLLCGHSLLYSASESVQSLTEGWGREGREGGEEGGRERGREGGREGGMEGWRERGREGGEDVN